MHCRPAVFTALFLLFLCPCSLQSFIIKGYYSHWCAVQCISPVPIITLPPLRHCCSCKLHFDERRPMQKVPVIAVIWRSSVPSVKQYWIWCCGKKAVLMQSEARLHCWCATDGSSAVCFLTHRRTSHIYSWHYHLPYLKYIIKPYLFLNLEKVIFFLFFQLKWQNTDFGFWCFSSKGGSPNPGQHANCPSDRFILT